jgi:hypothetical protein
MMPWRISDRGDPVARKIADRHYNRQSPGSATFVPPGRCLVLLTEAEDAFWVTSWPFAEYTKHAWAGAWICSAFRNEGKTLSSLLIRAAVSATRAAWGEAPPLGMVSFIDRAKVKSKKTPGYCYVCAGFTLLDERTKGGLRVVQMLPEAMPPPLAANGAQATLFGPTPRERESG